ncbi:MAG: hypothetical protein K2W97_09240 [Chthoniobacterales bacterium]|nr:hypothetical protein [Chthoniobacterales bacterium]
MFRPLITLVLLAASLKAQEIPSKPLLEQESCTPLLVCEYAALLKAVASTSDAHGLYQKSMHHQIIQVPTENGFDYLVAKNQKNEPMHHITDLDAMRYCNWKDHDSPTTAPDLEDSTEHGSYELNDNNQITAVDNNAAYQMLFDEDGFSIIHLVPVSTTTSPLMVFGETGEKKKDGKQETKALEEAGRRISADDHSAQDASSLASRTTLSNAQPKENFSQENSSSALVSSRYSKTPQGPSLVALVKTGFIATFLHLSKAMLPVAHAEIVTRSQLSENMTAWTSPFQKIEAAQHALPPEHDALANQKVGLLARTVVPMVTSTCVFFENRTSLISKLFPTLNRCNILEQTCSSRHPLAEWLQCDQLPNSEFYQRVASLKTRSDSLLTSPEAKNPNFVDFDILKPNELLAQWKALAQECQSKAISAPSLLAQKAWKIEQENAEQYHITTQAEMLRLKAAKSYSSLTLAVSTLEASLPKSLDAVDHPTQIASYTKALSACARTKKAYQDLIDHLITHRNSISKELISSWDNLTRQAQETIPKIHLQALQYQREILVHEATAAEEKAWFDPKKTKKITEKTITTLTKNWDQVIQKLREVNETSNALMEEFLKQYATSSTKEETEKQQPFFEPRKVFLEYKLLWAIATKETQVASVVQSQKMAELPDMSDTYFDPTVEVAPSFTFAQPVPEYIERVSDEWKKVADFCREHLKTAPKQFQQEWQQYLTNTENSREKLYMDLVMKETAYGSMKKSASDPRIKRRASQQAANPDDCDEHLKAFDQHAQEKPLPPAWHKFSAEQGTVCKELPQQAEENAETLRNGILKWADLEGDDKALLLTQTTQIDQTRLQLQSLLAHCTFGCLPTVFGATNRSFAKQEKLSQAITVRKTRESSSNELRELVVDEHQHYTANHTLIEAKIAPLYEKIKDLLKSERAALKGITSFFTKTQQATIKKPTQRASDIAADWYHLSLYHKANHLLYEIRLTDRKMDQELPAIQIKVGTPDHLSELSALDRLHQALEPYLSKYKDAIERTKEIEDLSQQFLEYSKKAAPHGLIGETADFAYLRVAEARLTQALLTAKQSALLAEKYKEFATAYPSQKSWERVRGTLSTAREQWQSLRTIIDTQSADPRLANGKTLLHQRNLEQHASIVANNLRDNKSAMRQAVREASVLQKKPGESRTSSSQSIVEEEAIARGAM